MARIRPWLSSVSRPDTYHYVTKPYIYRLDENKQELFIFLYELVQSVNTADKIIIATKEDILVTAFSVSTSTLERLQPCWHDEADN